MPPYNYIKRFHESTNIRFTSICDIYNNGMDSDLRSLTTDEFSATAINSEIKYLSPSDSIRFDTIQYMVYDEHFEKSYKELAEMFDGVKPYNLTRRIPC